MAVITLPQQNINVPTPSLRAPSMDNGGQRYANAVEARGQQMGLAALETGAKIGLTIWDNHQKTVKQNDFNEGKLRYIEAMEDLKTKLAEKPGVPTADNPYPNAKALEELHKTFINGLQNIKDEDVKTGLNLFMREEFMKRHESTKLEDIKTGREKNFDDLAESFQFNMKSGDPDGLNKAAQNIKDMIADGLVSPKQGDDMLDGAYQYKATEAIMQAAVNMSEEDGAKLIQGAESYTSYDGKKLAYTDAQKDEMMKSFTDRWKTVDAQKKQFKIDGYNAASNEYLKTYAGIMNSPSQLLKLRDMVLEDARSADFEGHTGLREKYVKMITAQIENLGKDPPDKDNPAVYSELMKMWGDESIRTQDIQLMAQKAFAEQGITEKSKNLFMGKRTELEGFSQGSGRIDDYFKLLLKDDKLDPTKVNELYSSALGEYNDLFSSGDWMKYTKEKRVEMLRKHTDGIINSYSQKNVADYLSGKQKPERMENFVASPLANRNNDNKDIQRQIQSGVFADTKVTAARLTQHQNGLKDMAYRTIGTAPDMTYEKGELAVLGQNQGDVVMAYKTKLPSKGDRGYERASKFSYMDTNGTPFNLFKWVVGDDSVWKLQVYDKGEAMWREFDDDLLKRYPDALNQSYWKNPPPPKLTPSEAIDDKNERIWNERQGIK